MIIFGGVIDISSVKRSVNECVTLPSICQPTVLPLVMFDKGEQYEPN